MDDSSLDESTFQLVLDQLEELAVTIIEELRQRPGVAVAIFAGLIGAFVGARLAVRAKARHSSPPARVVRKARGLSETADLMGIGMRLLQNPIVRGVMLTAIQRQLKRRLSR